MFALQLVEGSGMTKVLWLHPSLEHDGSCRFGPFELAMCVETPIDKLHVLAQTARS